mmetsp:Transcript_116097/g.161147  ORF Transcript_116097/g.161147 Transcript_116097/m.161147 type:complete len:81 (-) Transcript_116097:345-587(-)
MTKDVKPSTTLKDVNLLRLKELDTSLLDFKPHDRCTIIRNIQNDCDFLRDNNLMDYSLLLAIEEKPNLAESDEESGKSSN